MTKDSNIIIVDDHSLYRLGLISIMKDFEHRTKVIGEAESEEQLFALLEKGLIPDVVLLDIILPESSGIDIAKRLRKEYPEIKIIILSSEVYEEIVDEILEIGVDGYLSKLARKEDVEKAINTVMLGERFFGNSVSKMIMDIYIDSKRIRTTKKHFLKGTKDANKEITSRELDVIKLLCEGYIVKEIADKLNISPRTVETHKSNMLEKLGFSRTIDLIKYAIKNGIVEI